MPKNLHIVALGSSFASGACIPNIIDKDANRSDSNYAHQLLAILTAEFKDVEVSLTDLTVAGATTLNVLEEKQHVGKRTFEPQISELPTNADIVTFTCGGNDIRYISSLIHDSVFPAADKNSSYVSGLGSGQAPAITRWDLTERIKRTLDRVHQIAPNATVYLVEYLTIIGDNTKRDDDNLPLSTNRRLHYQEVARTLAAAYFSAISGREEWAKVVNVASKSKTHALGSEVPWVNGLKADAPYHPNLDGHKAVAQMIRQRMLDRE